VRHVAATVVTSSDAATSEVARASDGESDDDMAAAVTTANKQLHGSYRCFKALRLPDRSRQASALWPLVSRKV